MNWYQAEILAKQFLEKKGFFQLQHNVKVYIESINSTIQIDLLYVGKTSVRAFEVKYRKYTNSSFFPIGSKQYNRIYTALSYLFPDKFIQVDLIILNKSTIKHMENI